MYTGPSRGGSGRRYPYDGNYGRQYEKPYYDDRDYGRNQYYERRSEFPFLTFRILGFVLIGLSILILVLDLARIGVLVAYISKLTGSGSIIAGYASYVYYGGPFIMSFITILITGAVAAAISPYKQIDKVRSLKTGFLVMAILNCLLFLPSAMGFDIWVFTVSDIANADVFDTGTSELNAWFALGATLIAMNCLALIICIAGAIVCCIQYNGPYPEDMKMSNDPYWRDPRYRERYDGYDNYGNSMPRRGESMYRPPPPSYNTYPQRY